MLSIPGGRPADRRPLCLTLSPLGGARGRIQIFLPLPLAGEGRGEGQPCARATRALPADRAGRPLASNRERRAFDRAGELDVAAAALVEQPPPARAQRVDVGVAVVLVVVEQDQPLDLRGDRGATASSTDE
jgi:hypothetical protein